MPTVTRIIYICDCKKPCAKFGECQVTCFHTSSEFHAKHGIVHDVMELESDKFEKVGTHDECTIYIEKEI